MIISMDSEIAFNKIHHSSMTETLKILELKELPQYEKEHLGGKSLC